MLTPLKITQDLFIKEWFSAILVTFFSVLFFSAQAQIKAVYSIGGLDVITKRPDTKFRDTIAFREYLSELQLEGYSKGYIGFSIDSVTKIDSLNYEVGGQLGERYKSVSLDISDDDRRFLRRAGIAPRSISYSKSHPQAIARLLEDILHKLEESGYAFARVGLRGLEVEDDNIQTKLYIDKGPRVKWTALHITAKKTSISERFLQNYLHIEPGKPFSEEALEMIDLRLKQLIYLKQSKPAELLFTREGAEVFLYLESKPVSLFNGTVGLQQNPITKSYQLTGDLRLKLQNTLRHGELFDFNWRSPQPGSPQLNILLNYPYLFNTPFGFDGSFQLYKHDSSYLELQSMIGVNYYLPGGNQLKAFYKNYSSSLLGSTSNTSSGTTYGDIKNNQYGLALSHQAIDYLPNPTHGFLWNVEASVGNRSLKQDTLSTTSLVVSGKVKLEYYVPLGKHSVIKLASYSETYSANRIQTNELLRFGGNLSQRGFLEDELLASTRTTATAEYRFLLDKNSYLFAFYDQSWYERNTQNYVRDHPFGFGAGICFGTNIGIFSLTYALGRQFDNPILLKDSKIHFGYVAYF